MQEPPHQQVMKHVALVEIKKTKTTKSNLGLRCYKYWHWWKRAAGISWGFAHL